MRALLLDGKKLSLRVRGYRCRKLDLGSVLSNRLIDFSVGPAADEADDLVLLYDLDFRCISLAWVSAI